jgi:iron complex transport system ATP-binding protein
MLELMHVSCRYADNEVLSDINVGIPEGDMVGIIGPNGSGKTTMIKAMTKILKPVAGEVRFEGTNIGQLSFKDLARHVAVVARLGEVDMKMRVEELVLLGRIPHREGMRFMEQRADMDIAQKAMELTDVLRLRDRFVESLSSGERQLAFIARALAQEPKLLILDEPTSHLDITHQVRLLDLIKRLNMEKGLTVVIVLHDLNLASQYCSRLLLINKGRLWKDGTPAEVLTYQNIEEVYETIVVVLENPVSKKPNIFPVPEEVRKTRAKSVHHPSR